MEPDTRNAAFPALAYQVDRDFGVRGHDDPVDGTRNGGEIRVTPDALDVRCVWIDRKCFVAGVTQLAVDGVRRLSRFSRHARYSDALAAEKCGNGLGYVDHPTSSCIVAEK
jgi:hypothetical protein